MRVIVFAENFECSHSEIQQMIDDRVSPAPAIVGIQEIWWDGQDSPSVNQENESWLSMGLTIKGLEEFTQAELNVFTTYLFCEGQYLTREQLHEKEPQASTH